MRLFRPASLTALLLGVLLGQAAQAQMEPIKTEFFQSRAGKLDASGWTDAKSTQGGYSVRLPCLYSDFAVNHEKVGKSAPYSEHMLYCDRSDGVRFSVSRVEGKSGEAGALSRLEYFSAGKLVPFDRVELLTFKGLVAARGYLHSSDRCAYATHATFKSDTIMLMVEPASVQVDCAALGQDAAKFFDSFVVPSK